jgi:hypothetical protein
MSKLRAVDIRYNIEYMGMKRGISNSSKSDKIFNTEMYNKEKIKKKISHDGCPNEINKFTLQKFTRQCRYTCTKCWEQEAK